MDKTKTRHLYNSVMTRRLIELHDKGYENDFFVLGSQLTCVHNNQVFLLKTVTIQVVDQIYDKLTQCYKYIHTVNTEHGDRGLIVFEGILTN